MVALLGWFAVGVVVSPLLWVALRPTFAQPLFARQNFRGRSVPVGVGIVIVLAVVLVSGVAGLLRAAFVDVGEAGRLSTLAAVTGFGLLGLFDDLAAADDERGFAGHLRALRGGRLTTGGVKLFGGAVLAVAVVSASGVSVGLERRVLNVLADAAVVALAANLGNLFDRAPGRTTKVAAVAFVALAVATGGDPQLTGAAITVGAAVGLAWSDLREQLMLGDAGANPLGAALGLGVVLSTGTSVRWAVLVALVVLNVASELVSFSRIIDAVPPLRAVDRAGRRRD